MAARKEVVLSEFVEIKVPSKDRQGRPISRARREAWIRRWGAYLLSPEGMQGEGYEALSKRGTWRRGPKASFDPKTGELLCTVEVIEGIRMYCSRRQLGLFRRSGRALLIRMGRELNQEAVAYETKRGLHVIRVEPARIQEERQ